MALRRAIIESIASRAMASCEGYGGGSAGLGKTGWHQINCYSVGGGYGGGKQGAGTSMPYGGYGQGSGPGGGQEASAAEEDAARENQENPDGINVQAASQPLSDATTVTDWLRR